MITSQPTPRLSRPDWPLCLARFVALMALCAWLGGVLFLGAVAAPVISSVDRAHGMRILTGLIVGRMLGVFAYLTYACGILLLLSWWFEHRVVEPGTTTTLWKVQGIATAAMLALALFVGLVLGPRMGALQVRLTPQLALAYQSLPADSPPATSLALPGVDPVLKKSFDTMHAQYQTLTMIAWWMGILTLLVFSMRVSSKPNN